MRKTLAALLLLAAFSSLAYAGNTGMPGYEPPPCDPSTQSCPTANSAPAPEEGSTEAAILTAVVTWVVGATLP